MESGFRHICHATFKLYLFIVFVFLLISSEVAFKLCQQVFLFSGIMGISQVFAEWLWVDPPPQRCFCQLKLSCLWLFGLKVTGIMSGRTDTKESWLASLLFYFIEFTDLLFLTPHIARFYNVI